MVGAYNTNTNTKQEHAWYGLFDNICSYMNYFC